MHPRSLEWCVQEKAGGRGWGFEALRRISAFLLGMREAQEGVKPESDKSELPFVRSLGLQFGKWTKVAGGQEWVRGSL